METLTINGGMPLYGELNVGGSKNAVLPILAACILTDEEVVIHNAPDISDIDDMLYIMSDLGIKSRRENDTLIINCSGMTSYEISDEHVGKIRSSVVLMGAVIARFHTARLAQPGGCDIGARPIDIHLSALRQMGVNITYEDQCWNCSAEKLSGSNITLPFPSVGATENVILAASMASGQTIIRNAAKEPEIEALQTFINLMGGQISGAGTDTVTITGKSKYHACEYTVIPDRIVAGTYMLMTCGTGGDVLIRNALPEHNRALTECISAMGAHISADGNSIRVRKTRRLNPIEFTQTAPFPGFPTDLQPQLMAVLTLANGTSVIRENIYENRFKAAYSLCALGAQINIQVIDSQTSLAVIRGVDILKGAQIYGTDLRCNAALIIAGLQAHGTTVLHRAHFIERGYENIVNAIKSVGGDITAS